jgi:hypothetical protein
MSHPTQIPTTLQDDETLEPSAADPFLQLARSNTNRQQQLSPTTLPINVILPHVPVLPTY